jgi:hypothetical protein
MTLRYVFLPAIQALVNQNPTGTTFTLAAGTYRQQTVAPKDFDTFVAQDSLTAVMDGATLLTSFSQSGAYWTAHVNVTEASSYPGSSNCGPNPACFCQYNNLTLANPAASTSSG